MRFFSLFQQNLAIDLGTANTLIIENDTVVVNEPSIVAINRKTEETIAVGRRAMQIHTLRFFVSCKQYVCLVNMKRAQIRSAIALGDIQNLRSIAGCLTQSLCR